MNIPNAALEGWQLENNSAEAYEQYLAAAFAPWAAALIDRAGVREGERVLDLACGTGIVARRAAPRVGKTGHIVGIDLNEEMLQVARTVSADMRPAIEWRLGNAASLPFPASTFDAVLCEQALQFFTEAASAIREMHRVLTPNGRAAISVCRAIEHSPVYLPLAEALEPYAGPEAGAMMRSVFSNWSVDELRALFISGGFARVHQDRSGRDSQPVVRRTAAARSRELALASAIAALPAVAREALIESLENRLPD